MSVFKAAKMPRTWGLVISNTIRYQTAKYGRKVNEANQPGSSLNQGGAGQGRAEAWQGHGRAGQRQGRAEAEAEAGTGRGRGRAMQV